MIVLKKSVYNNYNHTCCICACCGMWLFTGSKLKGSHHKSPQERLTIDEALADTEGGLSEGGSDVTVEFGSVPVGTVAEKWIKVSNVSPVSNIHKHAIITITVHAMTSVCVYI